MYQKIILLTREIAIIVVLIYCGNKWRKLEKQLLVDVKNAGVMKLTKHGRRFDVTRSVTKGSTAFIMVEFIKKSKCLVDLCTMAHPFHLTWTLSTWRGDRQSLKVLAFFAIFLLKFG